MTSQWRRTQPINPSMKPHADDLILLDADDNRLARLYDTQQPDLIGSWRWIVWRNHRMSEGSAHSSTEARRLQPLIFLQQAFQRNSLQALHL